MNIEDRKRIEQALIKSEEKYRLLVNNLPGIVYKGFKDWSVEFIDDKVSVLTGYDVNEFNSRKIKWSDVIVEDDLETARKIFIQALKTDKSYVREYRIRSKTGDIHWIQERSQIVCDNKGMIEYVSGVFFDINDRKQAEKEKEKLKTQLFMLRKWKLSEPWQEGLPTISTISCKPFSGMLRFSCWQKKKAIRTTKN